MVAVVSFSSGCALNSHIKEEEESEVERETQKRERERETVPG